jgi:hypothetical protein
MTDNDIIKALEYCTQQGITSECERCEVKKGCRSELIVNAFDLINRQKAEIDKMKAIVDQSDINCRRVINLIGGYERQVETARAEAVKEFAEMLKKLHSCRDVLCPIEVISMPTVSLDYYVKKYVKEKLDKNND